MALFIIIYINNYKMDNNNTTLDSILESRLIFLSTQPDDIYFHWQVELYLYQ
jgi:hypothetical protein